MLVPVNESNLPAFERACSHERVFGSKCLAALRAYGYNAPAARFWVGIVDQAPSLALYLADQVLTVSSDNRMPPVELAAWIKGHGIAEVDTNLEQALALQKLLGGRLESSYYMAYNGGIINDGIPSLRPCTRLEDCFSVLQQSHDYYRTHLRFDRWSADIQLKLGKGLMELYQLDVDGVPVGTGSIISEDDECGVIAAVAVIPPYRGKGLGTVISKFLVNRILEKGKTPRLISGYDEVAALYRGIGFTEVGKWGELYL